MYKKLIFILCLLFSVNLAASTASHHTLPIELTSKEYHRLWQQFQSRHAALSTPLAIDKDSATSIQAGERLFQWIRLVNQHRSEDNALRLTSEETRHGYPIEKPSIYGPTQISQGLKFLQQTLPKSMQDVLYNDEDMNQNLPLPDEIFIAYARMVDHLYQTSVRWETVMKPNIDWYKAQKSRDVRGYHTLLNTADLDEKLDNYAQLDKTTQATIFNAMIQLCINDHQSEQSCKKQFSQAQAAQALLDYKQRYWAIAKANWDSFFKISHPRTDIDWTESSPGKMTVYFTSPEDNAIEYWLKTNVEDEYRFGPWSLEMQFTPADQYSSVLRFEPNITPHVSGGNTIVMDRNTDLNEYEVKWTIRHEYGHILRLPDCYLEFFDEDQGAAIQYQLNTSDLMCSRAGNMNERIYLELKKNYFNQTKVSV